MTGQSVRITATTSFEGFNKTQDEKAGAKVTAHRPSEEAQRSSRSQKAEGAFRTISEVADELDVQQHVLRFWETKFTQVKPLKRGGGRRYYRPEDVALLKHIHHLLYTEGYTIKGVQKLLKGQGKQQIVARAENENNTDFRAQPKVKPVEVETAPIAAAAPISEEAKPALDPAQRQVLEVMLEELKALRSMIAN